MSRFSMQEYEKFWVMLTIEAVKALAESGKIGALNLLFKNHPYTLTLSFCIVYSVSKGKSFSTCLEDSKKNGSIKDDSSDASSTTCSSSHASSSHAGQDKTPYTC